jgi:hypothetical protein
MGVPEKSTRDAARKPSIERVLVTVASLFFILVELGYPFFRKGKESAL